MTDGLIHPAFRYRNAPPTGRRIERRFRDLIAVLDRARTELARRL